MFFKVMIMVFFWLNFVMMLRFYSL